MTIQQTLTNQGGTPLPTAQALVLKENVGKFGDAATGAKTGTSGETGTSGTGAETKKPVAEGSAGTVSSGETTGTEADGEASAKKADGKTAGGATGETTQGTAGATVEAAGSEAIAKERPETAPVRDGIGGSRAIRQALRESGVTLSELSGGQREIVRKYGGAMDEVNRKDVTTVADVAEKLEGKTGDKITVEPSIRTRDGVSINGFASADGEIGLSQKLDRTGPQRVREVAIQELGERAFQEINALGKDGGATAVAADGIFSKGDFGAKVANAYFGVETSETAKSDTVTLADGRQVESAVVSRLDAITALQGSARDLSIVQAEVSDLGSAQTNLDTLAGAFATRITSFNSDVRDFVDAVKRADGVLNATEKSKLKDIANDYSNALKTTATSMIAVTTGAAKALGAAGDALVSADAAKKSARNAMAFSVLGTIAAVAWAGLSFNWVGRAQTGSFRNLFLTLGNSAGAAKTTTAVGVLASGIFLASGVKTSLENAKTLKQSAILPSFSSNDTEISNGKDAMGDLKKLMDKNNLSFNGFSNSSQKFFSIAEDVAVENFLMTMLLDLTDDNGGGPPYTKVNDYRKTMVDLGFSVEGSSKQTIVGQKNVGTQSKELGFSNTLKNVTASDGQIVSIGTPGFIAHSGVPTEYGNNIRYFDDFVWSASTYMKVLWP